MKTSVIPGFSRTDLVAEALLPRDWIEQITTAVGHTARHAVLRGGTSTSLEPAGSDIAYRLLDGLAVRDELPWLDALYRNELVAIASTAAGRPLGPAESVQAGVNLNVLDGPGGRYELHLDSNPLTGLLFVTAHDAASGGQLLFQLADEELLVNPSPGIFITFDARAIPHAVTPLCGASVRISAPMNFYEVDRQDRRDGLDAYLYGSGARQPTEGASNDHV